MYIRHVRATAVISEFFQANGRTDGALTARPGIGRASAHSPPYLSLRSIYLASNKPPFVGQTRPAMLRMSDADPISGWWRFRNSERNLGAIFIGRFAGSRAIADIATRNDAIRCSAVRRVNRAYYADHAEARARFWSGERAGKWGRSPSLPITV